MMNKVFALNMDQLLQDLIAWKTERECLIKYNNDLNRLVQHQHEELMKLKDRVKVLEVGQDLMDLFK
jgi:hypothetical protein